MKPIWAFKTKRKLVSEPAYLIDPNEIQSSLDWAY